MWRGNKLNPPRRVRRTTEKIDPKLRPIVARPPSFPTRGRLGPVPLSTAALRVFWLPELGLVTIFGCGLGGNRTLEPRSKCCKRLVKPDDRIIRCCAPRTALL